MTAQLSIARVDAGLLDALPSALIVSDTQGVILLWNRAAERLYGHSREQMLGANVMELLVRPQDHELAGEIMAQVLAGRTWTGEFPVRCAGGTTKVVRITDSPVIQDGELVGVVGLAEEVSRLEGTAAGESSQGALTDLEAAQRELEGLRIAMRTRGDIEQAKGILMATRRIDADAAFAVLTKMSQNSNRKLHEVALDIIRDASQAE